MLRAIASFLVGLSAAACYGQQSINSSQPSTGLENPWDVQTVLKKIATDNADLKMLFSTLHPQQWAAQKGAPTTYILQLQSAQQQERDIADCFQPTRGKDRRFGAGSRRILSA